MDRRGFLKLLGLGGATATAALVLPKLSQAEKKQKPVTGSGAISSHDYKPGSKGWMLTTSGIFFDDILSEGEPHDQ